MYTCVNDSCRHAWFRAEVACPKCQSTRWVTEWDEQYDHLEAKEMAEEMAQDEGE